jgi:hypothetical protein
MAEVMMRRLLKIVMSLMLLALSLASLTPTASDACSWDYIIWAKSKKSDTPLFRFVEGEKTGYIDQTGKIVIPAQFKGFGNRGGDFFAGLAFVYTKDGSKVIDPQGNAFSLSGISSFGEFSEGLAQARLKDGDVGVVINRKGEIAFVNLFDSIGDFSEGLAPVTIDNKIGYIDTSGKVVVEPRFIKGWGFSDGVARVIESGPCKYFDDTPCLGISVIPYSSNRSSAEVQASPECQYSFIDKQGKLLTEKKFADAKDFSEGLAPVKEGDKWGYMDKSGNFVIPPQFGIAWSFSEGLARVRVNGLFGYIDSAGAYVISPTYKSAGDFSEGFAVVVDKNQKYWFIDKTGKQAFTESYDAASDFVLGLAHIRVGKEYESSTWAYIDHTGKVVFTYGRKQQVKAK